jgi:hypothetical protein
MTAEYPRLNMIDTDRGPVDLGMLVGALIRSTEIKTVNERRPLRAHGRLADRRFGPRFGRPPDEW